ncbi:glycoside hydrolase family 3 N-terminal domain-containing protein [Draconibacterium mangrovi]|uniref:glycoside hydrolase family 3 N-terminal domain-containing protein n=1 Tax=Draconibacterium mangrovi TaxID=2697469 RepID=UPI0013D2D91D|nr:glycoside hydrolase family 3 N-terminal domain-containing protein [Draconibacterium mangrovi]
MTKIRYVFYIALIALFACTTNKKSEIEGYRNSFLPVDERANDLLNRMTVEEKIAQIDMYWGKEIADMDGHDAIAYSEEKISNMIGLVGAGSIHDLYPLDVEIANKIQKYMIEKTRLGIPVMFIEEGLHGYCGNGSTTFPIPLQLASAFDTTLVRKVGEVIGTEARAHGVHMILAPVIGLARDPRWGRVEETYGEDPYLTALNGTAIVKGMQGKGLDQPNTVIAEPKHFAVHSVPEAGSNIATVFIGEREARSTFLYPFEKAVKEGKAKGIMAAYHELDGVPCVFNDWLMKDVLRDEWGFDGFVLSDLGAIRMTVNSHKAAKDTADALAQTLKVGLNMQFYDFAHESLIEGVKESLQNGSLTEKELDAAVRDILRVKFMLGLFENPYIDPSLQKTAFHTEESQQLALEAAQKSIVLLKNDGAVLPVKDKNARIAVIGELAESTYPGGYTNPDKEGISILDGLKQRIGVGQSVQFAQGYDLEKDEPGLKLEAVNLARKSDVAIVVIGENVKVVGEGKDRSAIDLDANQVELIKAIYATGKPVVAVLFNGRPLTINWIAENIPAVVESWFSGEKGGLAIADVLLGNVNPSGKLAITFPRSVGQIPYYYNHKPSSQHNYVDVSNKPLYAFGHGISYTKFEYSDLKVQPETISPNEEATVEVTVKNTGDIVGDEVVQLYIRDEIGTVTTPVKALKGFERISLNAGESKTVRFRVDHEALSLWNRDMKRVVEPGDFTIMVGSASDDIRLKTVLTVEE